MAPMRYTETPTAVGRARAGLTRGVDPADRIKRWIGASARKRARGAQRFDSVDTPPPCEVITLTWAQTFGRPAKVRPTITPSILKVADRSQLGLADRRAR